jgi:hypothetical protein
VPGLLPVPLVLLGVSEGVGVPGVDGIAEGAEDAAAGALELDVSGAELVDGEAGAGVLTGAASLGALEVAGVAGASSFFLQPAKAASTTAVASIVFRIIIDPPFVVNNGILTSVRRRQGLYVP